MDARNGKRTQAGLPAGDRSPRSVQGSDRVRRVFSFTQDEDKKLALHYVRNGEITCQQAGDETFAVASRNFLLFDEAVPIRFTGDDAKLIELNFPRRTFLRDAQVMAPASVVSGALCGCALATMLRGDLEALHALYDELDETDRSASLSAIETVASAVVRNALSKLGGGRNQAVTPRAGKSHREDLFTHARHCIQDNLADPGLNSVWLAHRLGCSRATLYRAFAERGLTVANYIRDRRLDRLRFLLETSSAREAVGELAAACGLYDSPNLSRSFRARYHMTPTEARGIHLQ